MTMSCGLTRPCLEYIKFKQNAETEQSVVKSRDKQSDIFNDIPYSNMFISISLILKCFKILYLVLTELAFLFIEE